MDEESGEDGSSSFIGKKWIFNKTTGTNRPTNSNLTQDKLGKKQVFRFALVFTPLTNNPNSGRFGLNNFRFHVQVIFR